MVSAYRACIQGFSLVNRESNDGAGQYTGRHAKTQNYTGEYTFFSYMPGVKTVERFLHWWHVASRVSR